MTEPRKRALLIGNSHFTDHRLARLFAPAEDVDELRAVLEDPEIGGFDEVEELLDQPLQPVRRAIARLCCSTAPNDLMLVYYTGHGILNAYNEFYLALSETTVDLPEADGLDATWLRSRLDRCRALCQVLILDCCHSAAFMAGRKSGAARAVTAETFGASEGMRDNRWGLGRYVLTASDAQSFAWDSAALREGPNDSEGRTSPFTRFLVQGLASGEAAPAKEVISIHDLRDYVFDKVAREVPAMSPRFFVDGGAGEVVLARNPARLQPEVISALNDVNPFMRLGAIAELEAVLVVGDRRRLIAVRRILQQRFAIETDRHVRDRIGTALATAQVPHPPVRLAPGKVLRDLAVFRDGDARWCPEMVALPAGEFMMGSPETEDGRFDEEGPQHRVRIERRFAIGRYPVMFEEYDYFCAMTQRKAPDDEGWGRGRRPVINVSWQDAQAYVEWLSQQTGKAYRLPSEAEWEYAARAGTTTRYSCGNEITEKDANYGLKVRKTTEVGAYPANGWGVYDMHGNVWEWVEDVWHNNYQAAPDDGSAWTAGTQMGKSVDRVLRGCSWFDSPASHVRSAMRLRYEPAGRLKSLGFRLARTLADGAERRP